ncbi:MFS transporter [Bacillus sp. FJAT-50079]|uniref:MFS transporter n=1 Tax=Bacillus sp. FJAT-50079 TaxID=2833577 RepID=UPI001BC9A047|nr:MFS transporter [Bacillus sp. FJAT-50079]
MTDNFLKNKLGRKFGRRRFFLLIGSPLMLTYILLWVTGMNYWYYLATYLLFEIVAALVLIPWETLPSEMTKDFNERTKLSTARMFLSGTGTFLATFIPGQLIAFFGENNSYAYFINGLFFAILFAVCIFISYRSTWEAELTPEEEAALLAESNKRKTFGETVKSLVGVLRDYVSTFKIKSFRKHLAIYIFSFTAKDVFNAVFIFFCVYALNTSASLGANLLSLSIIGVPMTILSGFLFTRIGPSNLFKIAYSIMIVCLLGFWGIYLIQPSSMIISLFIIAGVYQIGRSMLEFTPWNVYPFIPDVDEIVTRQRREGLFAAVMTFFRKTSVAIATFFVGALLEWGGFVQGAEAQTPEAIKTIVYTLVIGTIVLLLIALAIALTFRLNKETHGILVDEIERLKNNGSKHDVDPRIKEVVEALTGYNYDQVWNDDVAVEGKVKVS